MAGVKRKSSLIFDPLVAQVTRPESNQDFISTRVLKYVCDERKPQNFLLIAEVR